MRCCASILALMLSHFLSESLLIEICSYDDTKIRIIKNAAEKLKTKCTKVKAFTEQANNPAKMTTTIDI